MKATSFDVMRDDSWKEIHDLAAEAAAADTDDERDKYFSSILNMLSALDNKYGRQPILLSIRADYTVDPEEECRLLMEAYSLALDQMDRYCAHLSATSLVKHHLHRRFDAPQARYWLLRARECHTPGEDDDSSELDSLDAMITGLEAGREK